MLCGEITSHSPLCQEPAISFPISISKIYSSPLIIFVILARLVLVRSHPNSPLYFWRLVWAELAIPHILYKISPCPNRPVLQPGFRLPPVDSPASTPAYSRTLPRDRGLHPFKVS